MSPRVCSSCRRRSRWWQVWMPKVQQCFDCFAHVDLTSPRPTPKEIELRLLRLVQRGVDPAIVDQLWVTGNTDMVTQLEQATDLEISTLNEEWARQEHDS